MQTIQLRGIQQPVSRLVFGCWGITSDFHWQARDEQQSVAAIQAALDEGVNFFDTAAIYGDGNSELLLGRSLTGRRHEVVIASKVRADSMQPAHIIEAVELSLKRLNTDYLDLYQTHWTDREIGLQASWEAMIQLRQQGKVRAIGVCNAGVRDLAAATAIEAPSSNQIPYNLLWRAIEHDILPACRRQRIDVMAYSPLMHGMLADKYAQAEDVPDGRARSRHFRGSRPLARHGEPGCEQATFEALAAIRAICYRLERTMADVALAWVLQQPGVSCVIAGARDAEQLRQNVRTLNSPLPDDALADLAEATATLNRALGPNPDMWQGAKNSRFR